ncbi:MAG TPA: AEC family transporter [Mariprofundaceae bacterium]|nr:AEC family transporter [Mariprofundaceae bacterium]
MLDRGDVVRPIRYHFGMLSVLLGMAAIIAIGVCWRLILKEKAADAIRAHLAQAVYQIFLPALVLHVLWQTPVDLNSVRLPLVSAIAVLISLLLAALVYGSGWLIRACMGAHYHANRAIGALLLASAFGNFTYLGLPVLTQAFGPWAQMVAIHFDLLASTPLLFTVGVLVAQYYGQSAGEARAFLGLLRVPAVWAAVAGLLLSALHLPQPAWLDESLATLGSAVVPLMLLSVGMALRWQRGWGGRLPVLVPVLLIQLVVMPLVAWAASVGVGMPQRLLPPSVIEGAMPTMVLGLVICDRFRLDTSLYAEAVTLSTIVSMLTLPLWLRIVV